MRNWRLAADPSHGVGGPIAVEDGLRSRLSMFKIIVINNRWNDEQMFIDKLVGCVSFHFPCQCSPGPRKQALLFSINIQT
jgi:hypothetical protein